MSFSLCEIAMEEVSRIRECTPMNYCFNDVPLRVRRGLSVVEVQFCSLDAVEEFIAIGTTVGIVYWCNRKTQKVERLRPEVNTVYCSVQLLLHSINIIVFLQKCASPISFVKVISSVDYMVAAGDSVGLVSIFILPKEKPAFLPMDHLIARNTVHWLI